MKTLEEVCAAISDVCEAGVPVDDDVAALDVERLRSYAKKLIALSQDVQEARRGQASQSASSASGAAASANGHGPHAKAAPRSGGVVLAPAAAWPPLLLGSVALLLAGACAWWPATRFDFSGGFFMDDAMIKKNANVYEAVDWPRIWRTDYWGLEMFLDGGWTHKSFRPLTVLTFRLNYWLHTFESSGFHITNLATHALASALLGLFGAKALALSADWSLLLTALFFVHPVHTESVLYIVGRADLLCLALILLAALLYAPCVASRANGFGASVRLCLASVLLIAAGLCKETGFCFFGLLAGWEILRALTLGKRARAEQPVQRYARLVAVLVFGTAACYWRIWYTGTAIERMDPHSNPVAVHDSKLVRVLSYALVHGVYGKLLVWPSFLCYDYSLDAIPLVHAFDDLRLLLPISVYLSLAMLVLISMSLFLSPTSSAALSKRSAGQRSTEGPIIGLAVVVLSFTPMANILFPVGTMIGERLLYIPSAGLLVTFVCLGHLAPPRFGGSRPWALLLLGAGAAATWRCALRVPEWATVDSITVADGLRQLRSSRVQFNFGNVHLQAKRYDEALVTYQRAIDIDPTDHDSLPLYHAGQVLFYSGRNVEAATYLHKAVSGFYSPLTIKEEEIFHDYALALWFVDKPQESILNFQKALAINPTFTKAMNNMACALGLGSLTGKLPREYYHHGVNALDQAVRVDPGNVLYWRNAIAILQAGGDHQRAAATMQQLQNMDPMTPHAQDPPRDCSWEFYFR